MSVIINLVLRKVYLLFQIISTEGELAYTTVVFCSNIARTDYLQLDAQQHNSKFWAQLTAIFNYITSIKRMAFKNIVLCVNGLAALFLNYWVGLLLLVYISFLFILNTDKDFSLFTLF